MRQCPYFFRLRFSLSRFLFFRNEEQRQKMYFLSLEMASSYMNSGLLHDIIIIGIVYRQQQKQVVSDDRLVGSKTQLRGKEFVRWWRWSLLIQFNLFSNLRDLRWNLILSSAEKYILIFAKARNRSWNFPSFRRRRRLYVAFIEWHTTVVSSVASLPLQRYSKVKSA